MKVTLTVVAVVALLGLVGAATAASSKTPQALYTSLLTRPFPDSQLPSGFSSAKVSIETPSSSGRHYHVVGEVTIAIDGPDPDDGIDFAVFPNHADALGDLNNHSSFGAGAKVHIVPGGVPGFPKLPGHMWAGSITGKNALGHTVTDGATLVAVVQGNVLVDAFTDSVDATSSGNIPAALQLLHAALGHLAKG